MTKAKTWALATLSLLSTVAACTTEGESSTDAAQADVVAGPCSFQPGAERESRVSAENGYWLARLSEAAYADKKDIRKALAAFGVDLAKPGYEFKFFEVARTDGQAFYLATPKASFVVVRGSQQLKDWETNFNVGPPGARVHKGYEAQAVSLWNEGGMGAFVRARHSSKAPGKPLYMAGHSLGGAVAVLVSHLALFDDCQKIAGWVSRAGAPDTVTDQENSHESCRKQYVPVEAIYTFGQPVAMNTSFAGMLSQRLAETGGSYVRFVNANDPVPASLEGGGFVHLESRIEGRATLVGLTRAGRFRMDVDPKGIDDGVASVPAEKCPDRALNDHSIATYASKIHAKANGVAWVATEPCQ